MREHSLLGLRRVGHEDDVAKLGGGEVGVVGRVLLLDAAQHRLRVGGGGGALGPGSDLHRVGRLDRDDRM